MAQLHFSEWKDERGQWLAAYDGDLALMSAYRTSASEQALTIYWRGRTNADDLEGFFARSLPPASDRMISALLFTPKAKIQLDLRERDELKKRMPNDTSFLRLEFRTCGESDDVYDATFIVWARLGLENIPPHQPAPDDIGVFLGYSHMRDIRGYLVYFVARTHVNREAGGVIDACLAEFDSRIERQLHAAQSEAETAAASTW